MEKNLHLIFTKEILEDDKDVKDEFLKHFETDATEFINAIVAAYRSWLKYDATIKGNGRRAFISAFLFNSINNLSASMKMFISGYSIPSGNLVRQTIESICSAILCSSEKLSFYQQVEQDKFSSKNSVKHVLKHSKQFQINRDAMVSLKKLYEFYHKLSHSSMLTLAHNMSLSNRGVIYIGPSFDEHKMFAYKKETSNRINLARIIANVVERILLIQKESS